jgi:exonuclease I
MVENYIFTKKKKHQIPTNVQRIFFVNYNTLLHVSTLLGHLQVEKLSVVFTLGCTIQLSGNVLLTVHCAAYGGVNSLWSQLNCIVQPSVTTTESLPP